MPSPDQPKPNENEIPLADISCCFYCTVCFRQLSVAATRTKDFSCCPYCATSMILPAMSTDTSTDNGDSDDPIWRQLCPKCRMRVRIPFTYLNKRFRCPRCDEALMVKLARRSIRRRSNRGTPRGNSRQAEGSPIPSVAPVGVSQNGPGADWQAGEPAPPVPPEEPTEMDDLVFSFEESEENRHDTNHVAPPPLPPSRDVTQTDEEPYGRRPDEPEVVYYDTVNKQSSSGSRSFNLPPRLCRWLVYLMVRLILPLCFFPIFLWLESSLLAAACCFWIVFGGRPSWWLTFRLLAVLISQITCRRCGLEIDAVDVWSSGQYTDYREQHVYLFKDPISGNRIGWTNCPHCQSTMLL